MRPRPVRRARGRVGLLRGVRQDGRAVHCAWLRRQASVRLRRAQHVVGAVSVFAGHEKTVTYVRFDGRGRLVTSGTDGRHRLWELASGKEVRAYRGHANARSFVGMSVWRSGGLIGCGSESNEVFFTTSGGAPIWVQSFAGRTEEEEEAKAFVSAVCWREVSEDECALLAGGSDGMVQVYAGRRKV
ncbi:putative WD repeat-containing protein RUP2-like [Iris pallida]|uniref:WD repeat-containing protein RUP2-like n=1 Tax=Iris pallida TaxID=29817 RepID=A0AAX6FS82_IRIPA|nr:putative WD repeat-containing protein RUP2-like [Iris pallida]